MANQEEFPSCVQNILQQASKELMNNEDGYCGTVIDTETTAANEQESSCSMYNLSEISESINFDVLCKESGDIEPFQQFTKDTNCLDVTGNKKVRKILIDSGIGQVIPEDCIAMVHYIGYVENLHEPFDVSYLQGKPTKRFALGKGELIPGLELGIKTMRTGENARFLIHPDLAYRGLGCPPHIPPNANVLFDVHLVKFFTAETYMVFNEDGHDCERFSKVLNETNKLRSEGNKQYKLKYFGKAISSYERGLELLHMVGCNDEKEEIDKMKTLNKLYANLSVCYLKQCAFKKVCRMGTEAMKYCGKYSQCNAKIFFIWGKALRLLKNFSEAKIKLRKSLKLEPNNYTIHIELNELKKNKKIHMNIDPVNENRRLPSEFWDVFDRRIAKFIISMDDVLTLRLSKNPDDIKKAKYKASCKSLKVKIIKKAGAETGYIAIDKKWTSSRVPVGRYVMESYRLN